MVIVILNSRILLTLHISLLEKAVGSLFPIGVKFILGHVLQVWMLQQGLRVVNVLVAMLPKVLVVFQVVWFASGSRGGGFRLIVFESGNQRATDLA